MSGPKQLRIAKKSAKVALPAAAPAEAEPKPERLPLSPQLKAAFLALEVPRKDWYLPSGRIIAFAHSLVVPAGKFVNKPLRLRPFQMDFLRDVYNPRLPDGRRKRRQAVLSIARRGGKTLLAALVILVHLAGPAKRANSTIVSAATTRKQASIVFRFVASMVRLNKTLRRILKVVDSTKHIVHKKDASTYAAISAEAGGQYGEGLDLVVYDELAQAKGNALYDALMTSLGSQVEPLMMIISTQAPANDHILSELIDYGLKIKQGILADDSFTVHLFAANDNAELLDEKEWRRANPALGDYRDLDEFRSTMIRATNVPSLESTVRNLYLNQRVQAKAPFLSAAVWRRGNMVPDEQLLYSGRPVYAGLDLSQRTDLSAAVFAVEDDDQIIHLIPRIWTPDDTLDERALRDRAPYRVWADQHLMIPVPGQVLNFDFLAADVGREAGLMNFARLAYDSWRIEVFKQSMARMGVSLNMMPFGQGWKSMSPAIDIFEQLALEGKLAHGDHPVLKWCVSNAIIDKDAAGNRKLTKSKSFGRIDPAVAAVMAVAAMKLQTENMVDIAAMIA